MARLPLFFISIDNLRAESGYLSMKDGISIDKFGRKPNKMSIFLKTSYCLSRGQYAAEENLQEKERLHYSQFAENGEHFSQSKEQQESGIINK